MLMIMFEEEHTPIHNTIFTPNIFRYLKILNANFVALKEKILLNTLLF